MANETIRARIEVLLKGMDQVESLKNAVRQLQTTASPAAADLQKLKNAALQLGGAADRSENDLRRSINALKDVRAQLSMTDAEYRKLTGTINKYQAQLDKATGAQQRGGRMAAIGQSIGAVAASGVFGGPEGFIGAALGSFGGPAGALAGGAVGAQVGMLRQQVGGMADYAAQIDKLKIALKGVTQSSQEYEDALTVINRATTAFNVTRDEAISGFTKLSASVIGAGGKVRDAELVFNGVSAAIRATGGSAEDVQGALTAMAQVFSKGKATAEEIQGQLGERLPGAVTLFAEATGRTGTELAKAFEQGTVGLDDVMKFAIALGDKFSETNDKIAASSESAGDRMRVAFGNLREEIGRAFQPAGAAIQDMTASLAEAAVQMLATARNSSELNAALGEVSRNSTAAAKAVEELRKTSATGVDGGIGDAILQWLSGADELETRLRKTDTQLQSSITRLYEAEGAVNAHKKALLASKGTLEDQGKAISAAEGSLTIFEGRLRTLTAQNKTNTKEAEFYRSKVAELKGVLESVKGTYQAQIEIKQIFSGQTPAAGGKSLPQGYRVVNGRLAYDVPGIGPVDAETGKPIFAKTTTDRGQSNFPDLTGGDKSKEDADKAAREAERLAAEQQRLNEAVAKAEIDLQNAVFRNQMDLLRRRFDYEQERIRQQRDVWAGTFEGIRGDAARSFVELQNRLGDLRKRLFESDLSVRAAQQELSSATRMEAVTSQGAGGGATTGIVARTGNTGQSTGAHLDLRWGDGRPITKADADKYFLVNGRAPSSFGVTSPYGPRNLFGRSFHSGIDFGTPAGSAITLRGGASFGRDLGNTGAGGYAIEVMTPEGTMRALHLMAGSALRGTGAAAAAGAQVRRDVRAEGNLGIASAGLDQARALAGLDRAQVQGLEQLLPQQFAQQQTQGLRDQAKALEDNNALLAKRIRLEAQGMRPEMLDAQMRIAEIELQRSDKLAQLNENLRLATEQQDPTAIAAVRAEIELTNAAYERQITAINALAQAQTAAGVALSGRIGQLRQELEQLTNFENVIISVSRVMETEISGAISSAVTGLVSGSQSIKETLSQMFSNIGQAFVKMAADIISKQLVMITLQTILKALGAVSGSGGGGGVVQGVDVPVAQMPAGMAFADGGVMTGRGPVPLKKYARGGVANRPQMALFGEGSKPEAYVPLPDGRRIPVALQGQDKMREVMGAGPTQGGGAPVLNMSFQSTNIGGVEYVSRDQLEAAMAETRRAASRDGAKRGMTMTLDRLQQSPSTRTRVGLR